LRGTVPKQVETTKTERIAKDNLSEQLVRECQNGCLEAQRELYERYKGKVYSLAIYMTGDTETARDLTQEIFVKIFRDLQAFRFESGFNSWLYRVAANTCLNALRRRRARREVGIEEVNGTGQEFDTGRSLEEEQMSRQIQRAVQGAILGLKPHLRAVVTLRYIEDLSYTEIAAALSCSEGTVASRLSRAHRLLERKLKSWEAAISS
jgi:RNA polymerase sigma-70 factor (ECF subfamily)